MSQGPDTSPEHIEELLESARAMKHGAAQVATVEEAVQLADMCGEEHLAFRARKRLIECTIFSGFPEKTLVAFAWCLGRCDEDPERFHEKEWLLFGADLLWSYKWVIENAPNFPQISRAQLDETAADMTRRYAKYGLSPRPVHLQRTRLAMTVDDSQRDAAREFEAFAAAPRDEYADCEACERNFEVEYLLHAGEHDQAFARAQPLIDKSLGCGEVPHITMAILLRPLVEAGELEQAAHCRRLGYRMCSGQQNFLREIALHMDYESAMGGRQALNMFERHLPLALEALDGSRRFWFFWAARNTLRRLAERGRQAVPVRLPSELAAEVGCDDGGKPHTSALQIWCEDRVRRLAAAFDERNGNGRYRALAADPGLSP